MTKTILAESKQIITDLVGNEVLYFDSSVEVKTSPHTYPFAAWGVCVSPANELYVMDKGEEWHMIELSDANAPLVISSLYQRLRLMRIQYAKAS
ncbi:MAG TPA: hypothetical protein VM935_15310 [Chitinophagaceae bacterium]|nr:hypothetical protein [Chitinophagaceae bacterium]